MYTNLYAQLRSLLGGGVTNGGELAWEPQKIQHILKLAIENNWVILGGDVLTKTQKYTYDNWYFEVNPQCSLKHNVKASVDKCAQYVFDYVRAHGDNFLFVLVISNNFAGGN